MLNYVELNLEQQSSDNEDQLSNRNWRIHENSNQAAWFGARTA
jgi:hypothetical protein